MSTTTIHVSGMTCDHCVSAVTEELGTIAGVTSVEVDLHVGETSPVVITSDTTPDQQAVAAAVEEAGYTLV